MKRDWPEVQLEQICDIRIGRTPRRDTPAYWGGQNPWVTVSELTGETIVDSKEHISDKAVAERMPAPIPAGTLLFSFKLSIGKTAIAGVPLHTNEAIAALIIRDPGKVLRDYLRYALAASSHDVGANDAVLGKCLNKAKVSAIKIPLPTLQEQERIVAVLDAAEELRWLREQADRRTADLIPALFHEMFGDPATNPKGWPEKTLSKVGKLDRGRSRHRPRDAALLYGGPYPFIQTGDVANANGLIRSFSQVYSEEGLAQSRMWPAGTLCITIAANIAKTAILGFDACFPDSVVGFIPGEMIDTHYVRQWFVTRQARIEESAPQAAQKNINLAILNSLLIHVPPLPLQRDFAARVANICAMEAQQAESRRRLDDLFQSLLHRAFRGEM